MNQFVDMDIYWQPRQVCWSWSPMGHFRRLVLTHGCRRYLPSYLIKGLAKNGTPISLWICRLPVYQDALLAIKDTLLEASAVSWYRSSGRLLDGAHVVHWMDELPVQQNSISDGGTTLVQERSHHSHSLYHFLSNLIDMSGQGQPCI
jgi:hypothetical protein